MRALIIVTSIIMMFFGCVMIVVGAIALNKILLLNLTEHMYHTKVPNTAGIIMVIAGIVSIVLSILGCSGAFVGKHWVLIVYALILSAAITLEIAAAVVAVDDRDARKTTREYLISNCDCSRHDDSVIEDALYAVAAAAISIIVLQIILHLAAFVILQCIKEYQAVAVNTM